MTSNTNTVDKIKDTRDAEEIISEYDITDEDFKSEIHQYFKQGYTFRKCIDTPRGPRVICEKVIDGTLVNTEIKLN